ncbi:MAG: response regulator [Angelakisella sp.]|nr:response regulator [Angelakisella sp.]
MCNRWSRQERYNIILLDWKMPGMDGIETARKIRRIAGKDIVIIVMTAYDWIAIEAQAKQAGIDVLISKPLFKASLAQTIENVFNHQTSHKEIEMPKTYDFSGKRILLVEDYALNIEVAKRLLWSKNCKVEVAENGLAAIEAFECR